jgi:hypothetical protein
MTVYYGVYIWAGYKKYIPEPVVVLAPAPSLGRSESGSCQPCHRYTTFSASSMNRPKHYITTNDDLSHSRTAQLSSYRTEFSKISQQIQRQVFQMFIINELNVFIIVIVSIFRQAIQLFHACN